MDRNYIIYNNCPFTLIWRLAFGVFGVEGVEGGGTVFLKNTEKTGDKDWISHRKFVTLQHRENS